MRFHVSKSYIITKSYLNLFWNQRSLHVFLLQSSHCTPPHLSISRAPRSLQAPLRYSESTTFASTKSLVQDVKIHGRFPKICLSSKISHTILKIHWRSKGEEKRSKEESSSMDLEHINYYPKRLQGWLKVFHLWQYWLWQHVKIDKRLLDYSRHPVIIQSSSHPPKAKSWACATGQRIWNSRLPLQHLSNVPCFGPFRPVSAVSLSKKTAFASRIVASPGSCNSATCYHWGSAHDVCLW